MRGVEPIETQTGGGKRVQVGRLQLGMAVVAGVPPSLIVGHQQHHIRPRRFRRSHDRWRDTKRDEQQKHESF